MNEPTTSDGARNLTEQQRRELVELMSRGNWHVSGSRHRVQVS